jgi:hypothetical protein
MIATQPKAPPPPPPPESPLILKRGSASRSSGQWRDDDYDVLEDGVVVGRIFLSPGAPQERPWMWARGSPDDYDVIGLGGLIIGRLFKGTPRIKVLDRSADFRKAGAALRACSRTRRGLVFRPVSGTNPTAGSLPRRYVALQI